MDELSCIIQEHNVRVFTASEGEVVTTDEVISSLIGGGVIDERPTFIIDLGTVVRTYDTWVEHLPKVECYYAVKCCSDPVVMAVLAAKGARFDVASYGEISLALEHTGAENLLLAHPIKTTKTLSYARAVDCDWMTFDSSQELLKIKLYHPEAKLLMRLKVSSMLGGGVRRGAHKNTAVCARVSRPLHRPLVEQSGDVPCLQKGGGRGGGRGGGPPLEPPGRGGR